MTIKVTYYAIEYSTVSGLLTLFSFSNVLKFAEK